MKKFTIQHLLYLLVFVFGAQSTFAQTSYTAKLSGNNELPIATTNAWGSISATLDGNTLTVEGEFESLTTKYLFSHLHAGMAGQAGGALFTLNATMATDSLSGMYEASKNTFTLTNEQIITLNARGIYINIHSVKHASGELRAQLAPTADAYFRTNISSSQEIPESKSMGYGSLLLELKADSLIISGSFNGLTSAYAASHIHTALAGQTGGVAFTLNATVNENGLSGIYNAKNNRFELTNSQKDMLMQRGLYVNLHTSNFASGELRGQITPPAKAIFYAGLSGSAEIPSIKSAASGALLFELTDMDSLVATGTFSDLEGDFDASIAGGSHIHIAHPGTNGAVDILLNATTETDLKSGVYVASSNTFGLESTQIQTLMGRMYYVNLHTKAFAAGELRGQILAEAQAYYKTNLSGLNEIANSVYSNGMGAVNVEVFGNKVTLVGGFSGLSSAYQASHIHMGNVNSSGGVAFALNAMVQEDTAAVYTISDNSFEFTEQQLDQLMNQNLYLNIHSSNYASGELRGQLLNGDNFYPSMPALTSPNNDADVLLMGNSTQELNIAWDASMDMDAINYIWEISTDSLFTNIAFSSSANANTSLSLTFEDIDLLLQNLDVALDSEISVYHRVVASDGSDASPSSPRKVNFMRGTLTSNEEFNSENPSSFNLEQNYPNPFNPSTSISFTLSEAGATRLEVFNVIGQKVATVVNKPLQAGAHTLNFDASNLSSGVFIYKLQANGNTMIKRMTIIK